MISLLRPLGVVVGDLCHWWDYRRLVLRSLIKSLGVSLSPLIAITDRPIDVKVGQRATLLIYWGLVLTHAVAIPVALTIHRDRCDALEGLLVEGTTSIVSFQREQHLLLGCPKALSSGMLYHLLTARTLVHLLTIVVV